MVINKLDLKVTVKNSMTIEQLHNLHHTLENEVHLFIASLIMTNLILEKEDIDAKTIIQTQTPQRFTAELR